MIARHGVRGLRVEEVASEAGVAVSLIYYHYDSRDGLVRAALDRANEITDQNLSESRVTSADGFGQSVEILNAELADTPSVRELSIVWGEVLASAVFDETLRDQLSAANAGWTAIVAEAITLGQEDGSIRPGIDPELSAEALTIFVDGVSSRWTAGLISLQKAHEMLRLVTASVLRGEPETRPAE